MPIAMLHRRKTASGAGIGTISAGVVKAKADSIVVSGYDGGTGASPRTSLRHAGLPGKSAWPKSSKRSSSTAYETGSP